MGRADKTTSTRAPRLSTSSSIVSLTGWQYRRWISALPGCLLALAVVELGWCPGSSLVANGSPGETDICVCSQGMWIFSRPCLRGLGVAPCSIIPFSPFCLSHKDINFHQACFMYTQTAYFPFVSEFLERSSLWCPLAGMQRHFLKIFSGGFTPLLTEELE